MAPVAAPGKNDEPQVRESVSQARYELVTECDAIGTQTCDFSLDERVRCEQPRREFRGAPLRLR